MDNSKIKEETSTLKPGYSPEGEERLALDLVLEHFTDSQLVMNKEYNQFNGRNLFTCIDDWTKRWNGFIPQANPLLDANQSRIFLNLTRNIIISYLSKTAMTLPKIKVVAVNKHSGIPFQKLADALNDLNNYSLDCEQGDVRFFESCLEVTIKGTVIKYEGYSKVESEKEVPIKYDANLGKVKTKKQKVVEFDNCYQEIVPVEDFFIANPYQPDVQKQPFVLWRKLTTYSEAESEFKNYKNWDSVIPGRYILPQGPTTFYKNGILTDLKGKQVEIVRYYNKSKNLYVLMCNGVVLYHGVIPFKDGRYPFAKGIFEPFANDFFWGAGFPQKIMGDQDLANTLWNMMVDKTIGSLLPFGISSDLDDLIEDQTLELNKVRKVNDVDAWKFINLPGVTAGEMGMMSNALAYLKDNAGTYGGADTFSPRGGKVGTRQIMLKQQEAMDKVGFSMNFLEDFERDRTQLRISHIIQFYSIPKIDKISTGASEEIKKLSYRNVKLDNQQLSDGRKGQKLISLVGGTLKDSNERQKISDQLSIKEVMGEESGTPTEAIAIDVETLNDFDYSVSIVKNSSYESNQVLEQATRHEYANWRLGLAQIAPVDAEALIAWVDESHDLPPDKFAAKQPNPQQQAMIAAAGQNAGKNASGNAGSGQPMNDMSSANAVQ